MTIEKDCGEQVIKAEPVQEGEQTLRYGGVKIPLKVEGDEMTIFPSLATAEGGSGISVSGLGDNVPFGDDAIATEIKLAPKDGNYYFALHPSSEARERGLRYVSLERHQQAPVLFESIVNKE